MKSFKEFSEDKVVKKTKKRGECRADGQDYDEDPSGDIEDGNNNQSSDSVSETYETGRRADDLESEMDKVPYENGFKTQKEGDLKDACWKGYKAIGLKKKGSRKVPNCVPESIEECVTTKRLSNGQHQVQWNGEPTHYTIINGSFGASGRGDNTYGIRNESKDKVHWIGSLAKSKKVVAQWLTREKQ